MSTSKGSDLKYDGSIAGKECETETCTGVQKVGMKESTATYSGFRDSLYTYLKALVRKGERHGFPRVLTISRTKKKKYYNAFSSTAATSGHTVVL